MQKELTKAGTVLKFNEFSRKEMDEPPIIVERVASSMVRISFYRGFLHAEYGDFAVGYACKHTGCEGGRIPRGDSLSKPSYVSYLVWTEDNLSVEQMDEMLWRVCDLAIKQFVDSLVRASSYDIALSDLSKPYTASYVVKPSVIKKIESLGVKNTHDLILQTRERLTEAGLSVEDALEVELALAARGLHIALPEVGEWKTLT